MTHDDCHRSAQAAVMARLWGALAREPFPIVTARRREGGELAVLLADGRQVRGPADAAEPFARPDHLVVDGTDDPGTLVSRVFDTPGRVANPSLPSERLRAEIDNSVVNLAAARRAQPMPDGGPPILDRHEGLATKHSEGPATKHSVDLTFLEQSVVDGHPLHPLCRTRMGLSPEENRAYGPEFRPTVDLEIFAAPPADWLSTGAGLPPLLPVHPWQRDHVLDHYPELRPTGRVIPARPLMSLRTVARLDDPRWHLKTSVDVQMTSATRIVSPAAVHNGPVISKLLSHLCRNEPIEVLDEVAAGAVLVDGEPSRSLAVVHRRAPRTGIGEIVMPFAVLSVPSPASGRAYAVEAVGGGSPYEFFQRVAALTMPPLIRLLHAGAALEAHGQNLLLVLRDRVPARLCYRDMGGVRISARRLAAHGVEPPRLRGDIATDDDDELRVKLVAAVISTVMAELIETLRRELDADPARLWRDLATVITSVYAQLPRPAGGDAAAMLGETLPIKATTAMRLAVRPLEDLWAPIPNPMADR